MHHHKSQLSRKRTKDGHGKKEHRQRSHDSRHHRSSSRNGAQCIHHMDDLKNSRHGHQKKRKKLRHSLQSNIITMTDQIREKRSTYDTGLKLNVNLERCCRCGKCEKVCPTGAIMVDDDIFRIASSLCNECGQCVDRCREGALSLRENQGLFIESN